MKNKKQSCPNCAAWRLRFGAVLIVLFVVLLSFALSGCESINQSAPVAGASMQLRADPAQPLPTAVFTQGKNADSPSTYRHRREGVDAQGNKFVERTDVKMGTVRDPIITVAEGAPWGEWVVAGIGAISLIAGGVLLYNGWPKVGVSLAAGGGIAMVVALTVNDFGWMYAIAILAVGGFTAWTLWSGYKSGLKEGATTPPADGEAAQLLAKLIALVRGKADDKTATTEPAV